MVNERWVEYEDDNTRRNQRDHKAKDPPLQLWAAVVGKGETQERWQDKEQGKTHMPPLTAAGAGIPSRNDKLMDRLADSWQFAAAPASVTQPVGSVPGRDAGCLGQTMVNKRWVEYEDDNARRNQRDDKAKDPPLQLWAAVVGKGKAQERWQDKEPGKTHMPPLTAAGAGIPSRNDKLMDRLADSWQFAAAPASVTQPIGSVNWPRRRLFGSSDGRRASEDDKTGTHAYRAKHHEAGSTTSAGVRAPRGPSGNHREAVPSPRQ